MQLQKSKKSLPFIVHIDKIKPYLGEPPIDWICREGTNIVTTEEPSNTYNENSKLTNTHSDEAEISEVLNNIDVITSNVDQEFRRNRPRREIRLPGRFKE